MKKCPFCAEDIQDEAVYCRYCHRDLTPPPPAPAGTPPPAAPPTRKRRGCLWAFVVVAVLVVVAYFMNQPPPKDPTQQSEGKRTQEMLDTASAPVRNKFLERAIDSARQNCDVAVRSFYQGTKDGAVYWNVGCRNGNEFLVCILDDAKGSTRVLSCDVIKALTEAPCFTLIQ